jgi:hypothetical protein
MSRTIQADGRIITVPDDATPEEVNRIVGPTPKAATGRPSAALPLQEGFLSSLAAPFVGAAQGAWHTVTDEPRDAVEKAASWISGVLPLKRAVIDPAIDQGKQAANEFRQANAATPWYSMRPSPTAVDHRELALGHGLAAAIPMFGPWAASVGEKEGEQLGTGNYKGAAGTALGNVALLLAPKAAGKIAPLADQARRVIPNMLDRDLGPVGAKIGDQTVQLLKGEAHPASGGGNLQKVIKDSGVGAWRFDRFAAEQLEQVKRVIRNTAQQTSDLIGPVSQDPAAALDDASSAVFSRAKPMYQQLDAALVRVPVKFTAASKIMTSALTRARKLGVDISPVDENVQGLGVDNIKSMQPLTTVTQVRSALLRAKRAAVDSDDAQLANSISDEVRSLNGEIDSVLSGTPLQAAWHEANRLWSKGHAISDTAYAFYKSTRGTPEAIQSPELGKIPVKIQGSSLVSKLNDLKREGTLDRGFTPEEQLNLRRSADIMDRARESAGYDTGTTPGHVYSFHTLLWRTLLRLPAIPLVRIMTSTRGMRALALAERATTPVQFNAAIAPLLAGIPVAAAGSQANQSISPAQAIQAIQAMQPTQAQGATQ